MHVNTPAKYDIILYSITKVSGKRAQLFVQMLEKPKRTSSVCYSSVPRRRRLPFAFAKFWQNLENLEKGGFAKIWRELRNLAIYQHQLQFVLCCMLCCGNLLAN